MGPIGERDFAQENAQDPDAKVLAIRRRCTKIVPPSVIVNRKWVQGLGVQESTPGSAKWPASAGSNPVWLFSPSS